MSPQVEAAIIAGIVGLISFGGTIVVGRWNFHATTQATEKTVNAGHKNTADMLMVQREQLYKTLDEQRIRTLNERFATAAEELGADKPAAIRLAGVYAMARLADDWEKNRQTCVDVLCGYLRMPYAPDPGEGDARLTFLADQQVRHTVIRVITAHLHKGAEFSWCDLNFDFTGVVFDGGDFSYARFHGDKVDFRDAVFCGGWVNFARVEFSGGIVDFERAKFTGSIVSFKGVKYSSGKVDFGDAEFSSGAVNFTGGEFSGGIVDFEVARFSGSTVSFENAKFTGSTVTFRESKFLDSNITFKDAQFSAGAISFRTAEFTGGAVGFVGARFTGSTVGFVAAVFSGGTVDFSGVNVWHRPQFSWEIDETPPAGVLLPRGIREALP